MASIPYRKDLDGLRCVAVLAIVLFHAAPTTLPGGFVGVDIFFVLSGYLITAIILREIAERRFSFGRFYSRRIRRIFPALIPALVACLVAGWFVLTAEDYVILGRQVAAGAAFVANFFFWNHSNYFDAEGQAEPLLHLWSLGVEEQFYLLWPVLVYAIARTRVRPAVVLGLLTALSFAYCVYLSDADPDQAFYSPISRLWQLGLGGVIATLPPRADPRWRANLLSVAGLALICVSMWLIDPAQPVPGWSAALPTAGAALLIAIGPDAIANRLLSVRPAVWVGLNSYPLYLWHWPLLSFGWILRDLADPTRSQRLLLVACAFLLAWATWRWIERPFRTAHPLRLVAAMAFVLLAGLLVIWQAGFPDRPANHDDRRNFVAHYQAMRYEFAASQRSCGFLDWRTLRQRDDIEPICTRPGTRGTYLLWGDSHAKALSFGLRKTLPEGISLAQVTSFACAPGLPDDGLFYGRMRGGEKRASCVRANAFALDLIRRLRPQIVFLAQQGDHDRRDWNAFADHLKRLGARQVVLVGPVPQWFPSLPRIIAGSHWPLTEDYIATGLSQDILRINAVLARRYAHSSHLTYVSPIGRLCDARGCRARIGNTLLVWDYGHLTPAASILIGRQIMDRVAQQVVQPPPATSLI